MKRKLIVTLLLVLCVLSLTACKCKHKTWLDATCDTPKTCADCGETEGTAPGHDWQEASCEIAKICNICGELQGDALGHNWEEATTEAPKTCTLCGLTEGEKIVTDSRFTTESTKDLYGKWVCTVEMDGDILNLEDFDGVLPINVHLAFTNDGRMTLNLSIADIDTFNAVMKEYMLELFYKEVTSSSLTKAEADAAMKEAYGVTMEQYVELALASIDLDTIFAQATRNFVYYVKDNTLYTANTWNDKMTANTFILRNGDLVIANLGKDLGIRIDNLTFVKDAE